jgi:hypothetical protein
VVVEVFCLLEKSFPFEVQPKWSRLSSYSSSLRELEIYLVQPGSIRFVSVEINVKSQTTPFD